MLTERWQITLFGELKAQWGDRLVTRFPTAKTGALLAYLAYHPGRTHLRETLVTLLWPDSTPEAGRNSLRQALASLRRQIEPPGIPTAGVLLADRTTVCLHTGAIETDVAAFETALQTAAQASTEEDRRACLTRAVALYQGPLLPGHYEEWVLTEQERLAALYLQAVRQLTGLWVRANDLGRALNYARLAVHADVLQEKAHYDLIRLYLAAGNPAAALRQYQDLERVLRERLGTLPAESTRALVKQLQPLAGSAAPSYTLVTEHGASPSGNETQLPPSSLPASRPCLPLPLTRFFGREQEVLQLQEMLAPPSRLKRAAEVREAPRLVTLTGPGGIGKTRLAIEAATRLRDPYGGAVFFADLSDLSDAPLVAETVAEALRLSRMAGVESAEQVVEALSRQPSLLVLDNFEQLADEGATFIHRLLTRVPTLTCLVTSRQCLGMPGEQELALPPLPAPALPGTPERLLEFASVQLFADRAQTVRQDFQVTARTAAAVAALCHRLEGLPLAIELAAAWSRTLTPTQMLERLSRRFDVLVSRQKGGPARHQTLRAAIDWSYRLLPAELQTLFARLSVFRGGWTVEAAEAICSDIQEETLIALTQLRERSLVVTEESGDAIRFRMLETLREYAEERRAASERALLGQRHAFYFLHLAEEAEPHLSGPEAETWMDRLETENENLRAALEWSLAGEEPLLGMRLAAILWRFWSIRGHFREGRRWLAAALSQGAAAPEMLRARILNGAGVLAEHQGDHVAARACYEESLALCRQAANRPGIATMLNNLGNVAYNLGDYATARALYAESLTLRREMGDARSIANTLNNLGLVAQSQEDYAAAHFLYEESLQIKRELGDRSGIAASLNNLGMLAYEQGEYAQAQALYLESLAAYREQGNRRLEAINLNNLANVARCSGEYGSARRLSEQSLAIKRDLGDRWGIAYSLEMFASIALGQGEPDRTARLFGAAEALREAIHAPLRPAERDDHDRAAAASRAQLGIEAYTLEWTLGHAMTLDQALGYALEAEGAVLPGNRAPIGP